MLQKLVTVNLEKLCDERLAAKKLDLTAMSEDEKLAFCAGVLDEVLNLQNEAGFKVGIAASSKDLGGELVFLCTKSAITAPQHAKLVVFQESDELGDLNPENRTGIVNLRLKGAIAEMNAARLTVDAVALFDDYLIAITTKV